MAGETDLTTVYRSADSNAETDATAIMNMLVKAGLNPVLVDDKSEGVVEGTWEVRVPPAEAGYAENAIADIDQDEPGAVDPSHELDLVTLATTDGATSEVEATSLQSVLDAAGISCVVVGAATLPNLGFDVRVAKDDLARARQVIEEARAAGPAAAAEAAEASVAPEDQKGA